MNTLIYKRTHTGDPNEKGIFGCHDCMGRVRGWDNFDAVIGVGGKRPWRSYKDIALKINWVGIKPRKIEAPELRGPRLKFKREQFCLLDEEGPNFKTEAPELFDYMFGAHQRRFVMSNSLRPNMQKEVDKILKGFQNYSPTKRGGAGKKISIKHKC